MRNMNAISRFRSLFKLQHVARNGKCVPRVMGMIHVGALPGTPCATHTVQKLIDVACSEAEIYKACNVDGLIVENMHDIPYVTDEHLGPEVPCTMTRICSEVRRVVPPSMPCGIQILAGNNKAAMAAALASGFQFIRAECFVFSHIADEGMMNASAGELLRYRRAIGADDILVFTDIKKKHCSHAITNDVDLSETARAAEFFLSDGVILTGSRTGDSPNPDDLHSVKRVTNLPVLIGSGVTASNVSIFLESDGLIIGSHFKEKGLWHQKLEKDRILRFMDALHGLNT